jgi:cytochrome c biogenesis protein CcmG, thiol:disulfide interchange protein DsbE
MKWDQKIKVWAALAVGFALILAFALPSYRQGEASVAGKTAEDFALNLSGKPAHLSDLRGKVVVLNFWATWCPPCVDETPTLNRLQQQISARGGVVLGVSIDEDQAAYQQFLTKQNIIFATYRDPSAKIAKEYGTSFYPETYVIDRRGRIARKFIGFQQWDSPDMLAYFDAILGQT